MDIKKEVFGKTEDNREVLLFNLTNKNGMCAKIINYGGIIVSLFIPDKNGISKDVVLGYDNIENYYHNGTYFGALIGRCSNRIKSGKFFIDGAEYSVALNDNGINHLHGGNKGFDTKLWDYNITQQGLELSYLSKDGEENYPGNLDVKVIYSITDNNELKVDYYAVSDKSTIINLTNHSYFNLDGHETGSILDQKLWINSNYFTATDNGSIPTGELVNVKDTPMDFNIPTPIGERIDEKYEQLNLAGGYDHNWKVNRDSDKLEKVASLYSEKTGIFMEVSTTLPGIQIYAGNYLGGHVNKLGKNNAVYDKRAGVCFETQYFPNAINIPTFESCIFKKGEEYHHTTIFKFSIK